MTFEAGQKRRAGRWAGGSARQRQWDYVVGIWRPLLVMELVVFGAAGGLMLAVPTTAMGFAAGIIVTVGVLLPAFLVAQQTGTVPTMAGADAERLTSDGLKRMRRTGWLTIDHIPFADGDVDHALLSSTTAYAIETKWSATPWSAKDERITTYCHQAARAAGRLSSFARSTTVGLDVRADPVLVLWGGASKDLNTPITVGGVLVMRGRSLKPWVDGLGPADRGDVLAQAEANIIEYLGVRDRRIDESQNQGWFARRGLHEPVRAVLFASASFLVGLYLGSLMLTVTEWPTSVAVVAAAAALGLLVGSRGRLRPIAWSWTAGCITVLVLLGVASAWQAVS